LAALLGFLANPVANIARAPAMAGLDPLNVNDVGDEAGADGGLDSSSANGAARTCRIDPREWISRKPVIKPSRRVIWAVSA
jgi:hypothetical protein